MSSGTLTLGALGAGVLLGLFAGEQAAALDVVADIYIRLLQMTVLPFIVISTIAGIGRLNVAQARLLARSIGIIVPLLWTAALAMVLLFPLVLPSRVSASFFSSSLVEPPVPLDLVALYIPSNPFHSLANAVVPAVVLFSVVVGVALIGVPEKERLVEVLDIGRATVSRAAGFVMRLTPLGLFAIAAQVAGTMNLEQLSELQAYVIAYSIVALMLGLVILPMVVSSLTGIPRLALLRAYRDPVLTAFVASDLFVVLPLIGERTRELIQQHGMSRYQAAPDVIIPASFNLPHSGKLLSLTFLTFAGWYTDTAISYDHYPAFIGTGVLAMFGSVSLAIPFLLDMFRVPADTFQLFLATGIINGRFGSLVAAVHTAGVALLATWLLAGAIRFQARQVVRIAVGSVMLIAVAIGGSRWLVTQLGAGEYRGAETVMNLELKTAPSPRRAQPLFVSDDSGTGESPALRRIRESGTLRVGYIPDSLPFAYVNARGALVGFDIDMAHRLAAELGVEVQFVPLPSLLLRGAPCECDLIMSGVVVTTERAASLRMSTSYLDETVALVVDDANRGRFRRWEEIRRWRGFRIGVPDVPYFVDFIRESLPNAEVVTFRSAAEMFGPKHATVDALALTAERGSSWTLLHPQLSVVVPEPVVVKVPLAYVISGRDAGLATLIDTWIDLKKKDGTIGSLYDHWILGRSAAPVPPRWSIARDVLHWVE